MPALFGRQYDQKAEPDATANALRAWLILNVRQRKMMLSKEKFQVVLILLGSTLGAYGLFLMRPFRSKPTEAYNHIKGLYAEVAASGALSSYAPWMIGLGGVALFGAFLLRDR